jgi:hypothetical protein
LALLARKVVRTVGPIQKQQIGRSFTPIITF